MENYDFCGWVTRANRKCSDGRVIAKDAFKHHDGQTVPMIWNHQHGDPLSVLGKMTLEHRDDGVYGYGYFNDTEAGAAAKQLVNHGDVKSLSIFANKLKQQGSNVIHGVIREVSLVLAGANPGAYIESVIRHNADDDEEEAYIRFVCEDGESYISHADKKKEEPMSTETKPETKPEAGSDKTVQDVIDGMTEEQRTVMYAIIGHILEETGETEKEVEHSEGGQNEMKHNIFAPETETEVSKSSSLSHSDQAAIIALAKDPGVCTLKNAMRIYVEQNPDTLAHGFEEIGQLFPDFKDVHPGAPELIERDQSWISAVMKKARKSPITRIRTRQADARAADLRAKGYNDRKVAKSLSGDIKLIMRTTEPQTVYRRDQLHRDDILDIQDFDPVVYLQTVMRHNMEEDVALAALVGDGREDTDPDKIHEDRIRPVWKDDEMYTIHYDLDLEAARNELQGSNTSAHFGENYIRSEAMVNACLYSRESYKGKGGLTMFIDPHELNVMLLARDLNGRRVYDSKTELARALNVDEIVTVEQMRGLTRTTKDGKTKKLLALMVNFNNYQFGCNRGGELTNFEDFDMDFNTYKYMIETRVSGALIEIKSAIALEEDVTDAE